MGYFDKNFKNHQIVNFEQEEFTCNITPKITITYSSYKTPDKNSENSSANDGRIMNMVPNDNTFQGLSSGSNPNLLPAAVMEKISKNTTKSPVQFYIENYRNPENFSKIQSCFSFHGVLFLSQPICTSQKTAENE